MRSQVSSIQIFRQAHLQRTCRGHEIEVASSLVFSHDSTVAQTCRCEGAEWNLRLPCVVSDAGGKLGGVTMIRNTMRVTVATVYFTGMMSFASLAAALLKECGK